MRFALGEERDGILRVLFACEREYLPAGHGELLYDVGERIVATDRTDDPRVQRMAECYVQAQRRGAASAPCDQEQQVPHRLAIAEPGRSLRMTL